MRKEHHKTRPGPQTVDEGTKSAAFTSHLGGLDFVSGAAGPSSQVRKDLTLLSVHARMHLAPPLLGHNGGWSIARQGSEERKRKRRRLMDAHRAGAQETQITTRKGRKELTA